MLIWGLLFCVMNIYVNYFKLWVNDSYLQHSTPHFASRQFEDGRTFNIAIVIFLRSPLSNYVSEYFWRMRHITEVFMQLNADSLHPFACWFLCMLSLLILMLDFLMLILIEVWSVLILFWSGKCNFECWILIGLFIFVWGRQISIN